MNAKNLFGLLLLAVSTSGQQGLATPPPADKPARRLVKVVKAPAAPKAAVVDVGPSALESFLKKYGLELLLAAGVATAAVGGGYLWHQSKKKAKADENSASDGTASPAASTSSEDRTPVTPETSPKPEAGSPEALSAELKEQRAEIEKELAQINAELEKSKKEAAAFKGLEAQAKALEQKRRELEIARQRALAAKSATEGGIRSLQDRLSPEPAAPGGYSPATGSFTPGPAPANRPNLEALYRKKRDLEEKVTYHKRGVTSCMYIPIISELAGNKEQIRRDHSIHKMERDQAKAELKRVELEIERRKKNPAMTEPSTRSQSRVIFDGLFGDITGADYRYAEQGQDHPPVVASPVALSSSSPISSKT